MKKIGVQYLLKLQKTKKVIIHHVLSTGLSICGLIFTLPTYGQSSPRVPTLPLGLTEEQVNLAARRNGFPNAQYPYFSSPNGCGPADWRYDFTPDGSSNADFIPACINHDICYLTGGTKQECDLNFLYELRDDICIRSTDSRLGRLLCEVSATAFYQFVDSFGESAFNNARNGQMSYANWLNLLINIVGTYNTSGTNPDSSTYSGTTTIFVNENGVIEFSQITGPASFTGNVLLGEGGIVNVDFTGDFSGSVTYNRQLDDSLIGTWTSTGGSGTELLVLVR